MATESVLLQARLAVNSALENEIIYFALFGIAVILLGAWLVYILDRWSWIPRKRQRQRFGERW